MIHKIKKLKNIIKVEVKKDSTFQEAFTFLCEIKKNTRLTDKGKMRFTSEMSKDTFDKLSRFIKNNTKED